MPRAPHILLMALCALLALPAAAGMPKPPTKPHSHGPGVRPTRPPQVLRNLQQQQRNRALQRESERRAGGGGGGFTGGGGDDVGDDRLYMDDDQRAQQQREREDEGMRPADPPTDAPPADDTPRQMANVPGFEPRDPGEAASGLTGGDLDAADRTQLQPIPIEGPHVEYIETADGQRILTATSPDGNNARWFYPDGSEVWMTRDFDTGDGWQTENRHVRIIDPDGNVEERYIRTRFDDRRGQTIRTERRDWIDGPVTIVEFSDPDLYSASRVDNTSDLATARFYQRAENGALVVRNGAVAAGFVLSIVPSGGTSAGAMLATQAGVQGAQAAADTYMNNPQAGLGEYARNAGQAAGASLLIGAAANRLDAAGRASQGAGRLLDAAGDAARSGGVNRAVGAGARALDAMASSGNGRQIFIESAEVITNAGLEMTSGALGQAGTTLAGDPKGSAPASPGARP